jgi:hypothetical protein
MTQTQQRQNAGSACSLRVCAAHSVRPCSNILDAVDLSARSVTEHENDGSTDRQFGIER